MLYENKETALDAPERPARRRKSLSMEDLPPENTKRWVISRKALVVTGIEQGVLTEEEACEHYGLTFEELESWKLLLNKHGVYGLRATRVQDYRE